ncbi:alanine--tRNA ligase [Prevotella communis]|uniref:alanine--tRNA ligase n=1 Tax=Prevotella communis TaxID=2913614 RepID=UPI001EDA13DA|nr:alanine--tRNA ligase [Prevotella communis]UKK63535.1 alanine--tRNA ligase [Prevotella communis]UKK66362.1 alanine--tRNA ligase [Prevotella communis]
MMTAKEIRDSFKQFFESKQHAIVPSAPMVIKDDPTLMFTNAGMNQWKDIILGTRAPEPRRRADTQKCLRVSGKHNDLEEVGHDTYHHTMFEMLGNWSFGDYFKEGAIDMAWEYLVDVLKLNPEDLYVTVFEGSPEENIPRDDEAAKYWSKHVPADHIINGNKHDNFWEMGDTGPCGPCSEIHVDSRTPEQRKASGKSGRELVNQDDPQVIEIWNIVFMQFNRKADGSLEPLSMNVIDTGMGFERLVRMMQGKHSNYDTDVFQPIIKAEQQITGLKYTTFEEETENPISKEQDDINVAMRVCADHLRAVAFSIADGQLPSNAKAGYVIRRILRRAVRYAYTFLGQKEAFLYKLLPTLVEEMGDAFPELKAQQTLIAKVMKEEEDSFLRTLEKGIGMLNDAMEQLKAEGKKELDGVQAFRLFDTYGFPLDLTELICRENGFTVNEEQFNTEMQKQKDRARNAAAVENSDWVELQPGEQQFVGYDYTEYECRILRYRKVTQKKNEFYELVLDNTPFYGEMGGQVGDQGVLVSENETIEIIDTKRENGQSVHIVKQLPKDTAAQFMACVDTDKRDASAANHTATHLLDYALKQVLGDHVEQKGSFVSPDTLRFDFSHFEKVTDEQLREVERMVNDMIRQDIHIDEHRDMPFDEAKKLGAIALFGEKYGDKVRVVRFGPSCEFCGGVHASSTGRIGFFKIISESSVAAGIRRIEAKTGKECEELLYQTEDMLRAVKAFFNNAKDLQGVIKKYIDEHDAMKKEIEAFQAQAVERTAKQLVEKAREVNGVKVITAVLPMAPAAAKDLAFKIRAAVDSSLLCVLGTHADNKPQISIMMSDDMVADHKLNAGQMVREAAKLIQGGGGGQPHFAQAGGKSVDGLSAAVDKVIELAKL